MITFYSALTALGSEIIFCYVFCTAKRPEKRTGLEWWWSPTFLDFMNIFPHCISVQTISISICKFSLRISLQIGSLPPVRSYLQLSLLPLHLKLRSPSPLVSFPFQLRDPCSLLPLLCKCAALTLCSLSFSPLRSPSYLLPLLPHFPLTITTNLRSALPSVLLTPIIFPICSFFGSHCFCLRVSAQRVPFCKHIYPDGKHVTR